MFGSMYTIYNLQHRMYIPHWMQHQLVQAELVADWTSLEMEIHHCSPKGVAPPMAIITLKSIPGIIRVKEAKNCITVQRSPNYNWGKIFPKESSAR